MTDPTPEDRLKVLLVENEPLARRSLIDEHLKPHAWFANIDLYEAESPAAALEIIESRLIDLVILDLLFAQGAQGGPYFLGRASTRDIAADVIIWSKVGSRDGKVLAETLRTAVRVRRPRVVDFLSKQDLEGVATAVLSYLSAHELRRVTISGGEKVVSLIERRRRGYPTAGPGRLRDGPGEVAVELDRLCRQLFRENIGLDGTGDISVRFEPLAREGLSSAIAVRAEVSRGIKGVAGEPAPTACVAKIGPRHAIGREVARYQEFVRYGVQLEERVELLGHAETDALGVIAYSFAGGVYGDTLVALDELLADESVEPAREVIDRLFRTSSWYGVHAEPGRVWAFFKERLGLGDVARILDENRKSLMGLGRAAPGTLTVEETEVPDDTGPSELRVHVQDAGGVLVLPSAQVFDGGAFLRSTPRCLVHGDMHGGNVMVEITGEAGRRQAGGIARVCLIDYAHAGPGPRCIDAAALEGSIRIAAGRDIGRACPAGRKDPEALREPVRRAANAGQMEKRLLQQQWLGVSDREVNEVWALLSNRVVAGVREVFSDDPVTVKEYLQTCLLYGVRQLKFDHKDVVRVRLCAWIAALYEILRDAPEQDAVENG